LEKWNRFVAHEDAPTSHATHKAEWITFHHPRREHGQLNYAKSVCSQLEDTESLASKEHRMMKMI